MLWADVIWEPPAVSLGVVLCRSAKPESPSWARLQQATPNTLAPRTNPVTTSGMEGMNMLGMNMSRQVCRDVV